MGKITGFMEYQRLAEAAEDKRERVKHYREFVLHLSDQEAGVQGARCMDCGIPFCMTGCPVNNIIPDWNDLVYKQDWQQALDVLHSTNNFPEFTGRVCPAPCEEACTLNINNDPVGIKSIEHAIIDKGWEQGWVVPQPPKRKTGKKVAVIGSGPAGLLHALVDRTLFHFEIGNAVTQEAADAVVLFDQRMEQMGVEGVEFRTNQHVGQNVSAKDVLAEFDAVALTGGAEHPRDLPIPGRNLEGVYFAMQFLPQQNKVVAGDKVSNQILATGKHVVVIGGGDTGSDCVGTSNRQGAASVTQFELLPQPPEQENKPLVWPYWPIKLRTSSSHQEGCNRDWAVATKEFIGENGKVEKIKIVRVEWKEGKMIEVPGSETEIKADLVLLAMGFLGPVQTGLIEQFAVEKDARSNVKADTEGPKAYYTSVPRVFAAGDMRRGQSLVVWAIREGRQCARSVDEFLMGRSDLPR